MNQMFIENKKNNKLKSNKIVMKVQIILIQDQTLLSIQRKDKKLKEMI